MLSAIFAKAPYFASEAFGGIFGMMSREIFCGDFASRMQDDATQVATVSPSLVNSHWSMGSVPTAAALHDWLLVLAFLVGLAVGVKKLFWDKKQKVPQPLNVDLVKQLATKEELDALDEDVKSRFGKLESQMQKERDTARTAFINVHKRIDKLVEHTSEIKGSVASANDTLRLLLEQSIKKNK